MRKSLLASIALLLCGVAVTAPGLSPTAVAQQSRTTVRIERYPRPPYSGATYYIYERGGEVICTKLEVCNKYDDCSTQYKKGRFKEEEDIETGEPFGTEDAVVIPTSKLRKHVCLSKFKLISK